ncbi:HupE/UreJ family protein [uncultured Psychroserpens sp.]|uniref:HupE/UreJ family protein n=1 Tax=uncultured Psychroserpens sp. TaxID=255436 RepID=UPI002611D7A9|nr:HupE/UreJ family protein [uncultured Psychroserpens sp.]
MIDHFLSNLQDGVYHTLHINAYDHILFLIVIAIPFLFNDWKRLLILITLFTIGHTVALILTINNIVNVNIKLVSFLIPLIIFMIAFFNIFTAGRKTYNNKINIWNLITLLFGFIHGFGFVNEFNSMVSSTENEIISAIEISIGIELGQLVIAFIVLFISFICQTLFRFSKRDWVMVISAIVVGFVLPMLIKSELLS